MADQSQASSKDISVSELGPPLSEIDKETKKQTAAGESKEDTTEHPSAEKEVKPEQPAAEAKDDKGEAQTVSTGLMNVLKDKLNRLVGTSSGYLEQLPEKVKERVEELKKLQSEFDELEASFFKEKAALEAKYQQLYEPFYIKRAVIVNGEEKTGDDDKGTAEADTEKKIDTEEKGVPNFWVNAMRNIDVLTMQMTEKDEEVLKYLKDIKWHRLALENVKGFKLDFHFHSNPHFKNSVLTKTYFMVDENEPVLERVEGSQIDWYPGKNVTEKLLRKKLKKGGAKNPKVVTRVEKVDSFFNFFTPPKIPDDDDDQLDDEEADELQDLMEQDYDIGTTIRDKLIPHAVTWYIGEGLEVIDEESDEEEEDEEEEED